MTISMISLSRTAGYGSGLVCKVTAKNLSNRAKTGIATGSEVGSFGLYFAAEALAESDVKYSSLEGKEHKKKAALLRCKKGGELTQINEKRS